MNVEDWVFAHELDGSPFIMTFSKSPLSAHKCKSSHVEMNNALMNLLVRLSLHSDEIDEIFKVEERWDLSYTDLITSSVSESIRLINELSAPDAIIQFFIRCAMSLKARRKWSIGQGVQEKINFPSKSAHKFEWKESVNSN